MANRARSIRSMEPRESEMFCAELLTRLHEADEAIEAIRCKITAHLGTVEDLQRGSYWPECKLASQALRVQINLRELSAQLRHFAVVVR